MYLRYLRYYFKNIISSLRYIYFRATLLLDIVRKSPQEAKRLQPHPVIRPTMLPGSDGKNINGPSLIRIPGWVHNPLGKYYLYFAHHHRKYIRLANADDLAGPWNIYTSGVLQVEECICNAFPTGQFERRKHIASPDVHIDNNRKEIFMYFHCPAYTSGDPGDTANYPQVTFRATSTDGLHFRTQNTNTWWIVFQSLSLPEHVVCAGITRCPVPVRRWYY